MYAMPAGNSCGTPLQRALGRAYRWLAQLESGAMPSIQAIASAESLDRSYVSRVLGLTLLAPECIAAILDDTLPAGNDLFRLAVDSPSEWQQQTFG